MISPSNATGKWSQVVCIMQCCPPVHKQRYERPAVVWCCCCCSKGSDEIKQGWWGCAHHSFTSLRAAKTCNSADSTYLPLRNRGKRGSESKTGNRMYERQAQHAVGRGCNIEINIYMSCFKLVTLWMIITVDFAALHCQLEYLFQ